MKVSRRQKPFSFLQKRNSAWLLFWTFLSGFLLVYMLLGEDASYVTVMTSSDQAANLQSTVVTVSVPVSGVAPMLNIADSTLEPTIPEGPKMDKLVERQVVWSRARSDRSGAAIQDMLMCHAFSFQKDMIYGGACARDWTLPQFQGKKKIHEELIQAVGLSNVLQFRCPEEIDTKMRNRYDYIQNDTEIFSASYVEHLQGLIDYPPRQSVQQIAVHIRRGDISPCRPRTRGYPRYLPNQHFLRLISRYNPTNNSQVIVYSESESFEPFDEFRQQGHTVVLDGSIGDVWKGILVSDVVILSRSSFSLVPAIMSKGTVVYTPFWHEPLPHWHIVEEQFLNETLDDFRRLKATCPPKNKKNKVA